MSSFKTAEILKSLFLGDLISSVVNSNEFKIAMGQVDVEKYLSKEIIEQVINNIFTNTEVKKRLRKMIIDIMLEERAKLFEMKDDERSDAGKR